MLSNKLKEILYLSKNIKADKFKHLRAIPFRVRWEQYRRDNFKCVVCGDTEDLTIDHIVSILKGGRNIPLNFTTLCFD